MPSPSDLDLKLLDLFPSDINGFIRFAFICVGILIICKIYIKRRWS
ncbi:hypothetical protein LGL08_20240 [Clostridium estertheticum]|nr:hypothetical protein [Clostridium estertheticum]MCB2309036.1 hypothetical protein [Clostridium estertheticum]MCB2346830.1 hypothetical protein [Clostridium estertheticum]MCB2351858.1 hypothetical protein [Clostridium estertheticum]WAG48386.1 hypothetical protein LL127_23045 [Clostridium estertheticum]